MTALSFDARPIQVDPLIRFARRLAMALLCLAALIGLAFWLTPYAPAEVVFLDRLTAPSAEQWFATDRLGRDIFTRLLHGTAWSLGLSLLIATIGLIVGTIVGFVAARSGRLGDFALVRATPVGQVVLFRSAVALVPLVLFLIWTREFPGGLRTKRPIGHVVRFLVGWIALFASFA